MNEFRHHWDFDPEIEFLNHGSFGACPRSVLAQQREWQQRMERNPQRFFARDLEPLLDEVRTVVADLVHCDADDLALLPNATSGVNAVLRSLQFSAGDELLVTDHAYNACRNALDFVANRSGADVVVAPIPFPIDDPQRVVDSVVSRATERTRLCLLDHVTSPTGLVLPIEPIVQQLAERGIDTLVDGAHAIGMLPLDLRQLGAAYYTSNCHKWLCTPKGAAMLFVRRDRQAAIRPLAISHGANAPRTDRSLFRLEFDWTGTTDYSPLLCIPTALQFLESLLPGGLPELQQRNRSLALVGRTLLGEALGTAAPAPESMIASLASVVLPLSDDVVVDTPTGDPLQDQLWQRHRIEVPTWRWPHPRVRLLRISPQIYNSREQYEQLATALVEELRREPTR